MRALANYRDCGFFVLRSPALSVELLSNMHEEFSIGKNEHCLSDKAAYRAKIDAMAHRLHELAHDAFVSDALWVASPGLISRLKEKGVDEVVSDGKMLATLYKYIVRMSSRCTPFGLFANFTFGKTSSETLFTSDETPIEKRSTRVDSEYIYQLVSYINSNKSLRNSIRYRANTSMHRIGERVHYAEINNIAAGKGVSYSLSAVGITDYLMVVLDNATSPVHVSDLAKAICVIDADVEHDEACEFIHELIDNQLLVPEITPAVTGEKLLHGLIAGLKHIPEAEKLSNVLVQANGLLERLDTGNAKVADYTQVLEKLRELPPKINEQHLFQVDANRQYDVTMGQAVLDDIRRSVDLLHRISPPTREGSLDEFKRRFTNRYGNLEVSLCEALDVDAGIGFDGRDGRAASMEPLLKGIRGLNAGGNGATSLSPRDIVLAEVVQRLDRGPDVELKLDKKLIDKLENTTCKPLPDAWSAFVVMLGHPDIESPDELPRIHLKTVSGPGGANLFGRFCHVNSELKKAVKNCMDAEEQLDPKSVYAEIAHMPEGRIGNVLRRPVLRDHEIVYLCESSLTGENRIHVQDLLVSVQGGQVVLKSRRSGKRIIPRLASAHNYRRGDNLGMYRFLCSLQNQGVQSALYWDWGGLSILDFLPRVVYQRTVLAPASWKIHPKDLMPIINSKGVDRFEATKKIRSTLNLPRSVLVAEADNSIRFDLECPLSIDMFADFLRRNKSGIRISEVLPERFGTPLKVNGNRYCNEAVVPFVRSMK